MQNKKYLSLLGIARRAGRLSMGHDTVKDSIRKRKAKLVIFSSDISKRLIEEIGSLSERYQPSLPSIRIAENMDEIHSALVYRAGVIAVND